MPKQKKQTVSDRNKKLASELHAKGLLVYEIFNPNPAKNDEVMALLVAATKPPKRWLEWVYKKLI
jgi:hypothetical protein